MLADKVLYFLKKYFVKKATQRHLVSCLKVQEPCNKHCRPPPSLKPVYTLYKHSWASLLLKVTSVKRKTLIVTPKVTSVNR